MKIRSKPKAHGKYYLELTSCGLYMSRLWHCFGHTVDTKNLTLGTAEDMLDASHCNVIAINTHRLSEPGDDYRDKLVLGVSDIKIDPILNMIDRLERKHSMKYTKFVNVNLQETPEDIVRHTIQGLALIGSKFIKYEGMNAAKDNNVNTVMIEATKMLIKLVPQAVLMPQINCEFETAKWFLEETECPILRVQGSTIGSCFGIKNESEFKKICELARKFNVPVWLEGGVGSVEDIDKGFKLGASGTLLGSWQFKDSIGPVEVLGLARQAIEKIVDNNRDNIIF